MIAIHRGLDILLEVGVNQGSIRRFNLMKEDFIRLKFSLTTNTPLLIGDYVDLTDYINSCDNENFRIKNSIADQTTKKFVLDRNYYPTFNKDTGGWDYDVQINAYYHQWKNKIFMFNPSKGAAESSFSLTDTIFTHAALLVKNLKFAEFTYNNTEFNVAYQEEFDGQLQAKGMKVITYSALSIYAALDLIAQAFECEWWLDGGSTIYFGYRKGDETTELTLNKEIADASISDSDGVHATRIYAFGGTTNVPKHYRDKLEFKVSEIVNTPVGNTFRDTSKPITSNWFRGKYSEQPIIMNFEGEAIDSVGYICQKYYSAPLSAGNIEGTIKGLSMTFEPTIYGYYEDSDIWPSLDIEVALDVTDEHWLYRQSQPKQVLLRKCSAMNGTAIGGVYNGNFKYVDGAIKKYISNTESGNGMVGISSFPIEAGKYYAVHIEDTAYSELLDYFILFSESNVAEGITVSELWSFDKKKKYGFYYKAEKNGYLLIPQPSYTKATPIVKEVERVQYSLFESPYNFQWVYDTVSWSNILLRADIMDGADGVHDLATSVHHNVKYRVITSDWSIEAQRADKAVDTIIVIGGEERECTINPLFASSTNGHLIMVNGYTPKIGDVFTFPNIVINRVEPSYFSPDDDGVQNGVVQKNLMLPIGTNYVQADGVADANVVEAIMVYDWIYPKTALKVTNVEPFNKWEVEIEDGQTIYTTTYDITLPIEDYEDDIWVDPSQMSAIFQSGKAAGLRFELNYIKKTKNDVTFRLVPNEDYSITVPNEATIPAIDDEIILEGIDISFLSGSAITNAENELLAQANKDIIETSKEDKVVDITLTSIDAYNRGRIALGTLTSLVGVLSSEDGAYDSRVLGFEECLDIPWDKPKYIIGDRNYYNRQASIESKLENIEKGSITISGANTGGGGSNIPIIKVKDSTKPTDANVYSALRSREEFAKRKEEETFSEKVTFNKDIDVKGSTKTKNLSVLDNANISSLDVSNDANIQGHTSMAGGATFGEFQDVAGSVQGAKVDDKGVGTFAGLKSKYFEIYELIYNQQTAEDGIKMFTDRGVIEEVKDITYYGNDRQGTYSDTDEYFKADALIKLRKERDGQLITFKKWDVIHGMVNSIGDSGEYAIGGEAWFRVVSVNQDTFEMEVEIYADRETPAGKNISPTSSMVIARWGYKGTDDLRRQTSFYLSCEDGNITQLMYVTKPIIGLNNYGSVLGVLPPALYEYVQNAYAYVNPEQPYLYARGIAVQDFMLLDYLGQAIKQARYRGVWNQNTAEREPYVITETTYDTVTHNGSLWQLNASHTTKPPSDDSDEWTKIVSKGDDSSIASYTIIPDPDKVHLDTDGTLSTSTISVKIGEQLPDGTYTEIQDQEELEAKGFSVWYAVDGIGERTMLNISPAAIFELEDGSGRIITEEEGYLLLEGEEIDANAISSHIALYLVDAKGIDRAVSFIWIVKDGENGESPLLFGATPSNLSVTIDAETGKTIEAFEQTVRVFVQRGDKKISPFDDEYGWTVMYDFPFDIEYSEEEGQDYIELTINIPKDTSTEDFGSILNIDIVSSANSKITLGRTSITINKPERGIVGPMGNTGPLPYAAGAWNDTTNYPAATDIAPYVLYPNAENGSYYVRTANEIHKGEDGKDLNPADESKYGSKGGWRVMPQYEVLYVKMLFANFGRLAKAVFHGDYMFSAMGVSDSGTYASYDAFVDGNSNKNEPMFDENGRLSGSFVPNLFLDLENGASKMGKLSESYYKAFPYSDESEKYEDKLVAAKDFVSMHKIDFDACHNVSHFAMHGGIKDSGNNTGFFKSCVVTLPMSGEDGSWHEDGTHCTIIHEYSGAAAIELGARGGGKPRPLIVCSNPNIFDYDKYEEYEPNKGEGFYLSTPLYPSGSESTPQTEHGWMIWRNRPVQFVFLTAGSILKLRSSYSNGCLVWYIENSSEFELKNVHIQTYRDYVNEEKAIELSFSIDAYLSKNEPVALGTARFDDGSDWIIDAAAAKAELDPTSGLPLTDGDIKKFAMFRTNNE